MIKKRKDQKRFVEKKKNIQTDETELFKIRPRVIRNLHKHCVSLWITSATKFISVEKPDLGFMSIDMLSKNPEFIRSGTLTLVKTHGKYFGITCDHVIQTLEEKNKLALEGMVSKFCLNIQDLKDSNYKPYILTTVVKHNIDLSSCVFLQPQSQYPESRPDIRIASMDEKIIKLMGKIAIDLDKYEIVPNDLDFAIAVGFPETLKHLKESDEGHYFAMPHCTVTVALKARSDNIVLHSVTKEKVERNFSGMSGGPIFWHKNMDYNLLGIIFESPRDNLATFPENEIMLLGVSADSKIVKRWIEDLFPEQ